VAIGQVTTKPAIRAMKLRRLIETLPTQNTLFLDETTTRRAGKGSTEPISDKSMFRDPGMSAFHPKPSSVQNIKTYSWDSGS
jgi:hypothetical protein